MLKFINKHRRGKKAKQSIHKLQTKSHKQNYMKYFINIAKKN